jgi:hypothetical protein
VSIANSTNGDILMGLADRPGADMTARLLLALTALYVERPTHTPQEQQQYLELALRLIVKVDAPTRATVGSMLRRHPDAPAEIFARLEGSRAADPEPARTPIMTAPAAPGLSPKLAPDATPQAIPEPGALGEAFFAASAAERRRLLSLLAAERGNQSGPEPEVAPEDSERIYEGLDLAAMQGRIGEFTREFERLFAMPKSLCERILNDRSGEPMVIAAKANGMPIAVLQRILLLVNPAVSHSVRRVFDLTDLFHELDRSVAQKLVALWRAQAKPNDPTVEPAPEPGERKPAAPRDISAVGLRSRFGALTERIQRQGVNAPPDPGSVARRDLRSR